jgi:hypothetical protein
MHVSLAKLVLVIFIKPSLKVRIPFLLATVECVSKPKTERIPNARIHRITHNG